MASYDALLVISFGGPEGPDEVIPFLENVLRGRNVPRERMLEVAEHYQHFGGVSPINAQCRALVAALENEFAERGIQLPIYWGNRNWRPLLTDTVAQMQQDGVQSAISFVTSAYSSYSSCRQYLEDIERARAAVGSAAPRIDKLRPFYNHPGFLQAVTDHTREALHQIPQERWTTTRLVFTAHSIPLQMAKGCEYERQLLEASRLVSERLQFPHWKLVYQSRSGPPSQPWLEPDVLDHLQQLHEQGNVSDVVLMPIGFTSDHMEVLYDLDTEARQLCDDLGLGMVRARTAGTHPQTIRMIADLVLERTEGAPRLACGELGVWPDQCPSGCCPSGRPPTPVKNA